MLPSSRLGRVRRQAEARCEGFESDPLPLDASASQMIPFLRPTPHARLRMAQRNLSQDEISYVLLYGQSWHKAGATITYLRQKDIPPEDQADQRIRQLIGAAVVATDESGRVILTAYRNRHAGLRNIKHKSDYGR